MDAQMPVVNNVTRLLQSHKVRYIAHELPAEKLGALETARLLGVEPATVYKTIIATHEKSVKKNPLLVMLSGTNQLDLKKLAAFLGVKKVYIATEREAETWTGLRAGGISPLALMNRGFRVIIDTSAQEHDEIHVSGGQRGLNIQMRVDDLVQLTRARFAAVRAPMHDT
jgi:Cys-tRNA(Pro)/Cys-tRNA(Cys) deacylase